MMVNSVRKESAPLGCRFFSYRVDPFWNVFTASLRSKQKARKGVSFVKLAGEKWWCNHTVNKITIIITGTDLLGSM